MTLALMAKAFTLNNTTSTNNNQRSSSNPSNMQIAQPGMNMDQDRHMLMVEDNIVENMNRLSVVSEIANQYGNKNVVTAPAKVNGNGINATATDCLSGRSGIQSTQEEFKFMDAADASEETEKVKANCILENNLQQASTPGTQSNKAPVYDSDGSAKEGVVWNCSGEVRVCRKTPWGRKGNSAFWREKALWVVRAGGLVLVRKLYRIDIFGPSTS
nr:hypothetical protein [Tanacetum cinerariifolium]